MRQGDLDLIIEGGWLIDGLGGPRRRADVGVAGERIAAIGDLSAVPARRRVDTAGRIVAPGFIDVHGHDDLMFVEKPDLAWKTSQGITSVVVGNCGVSGAPAPQAGNTAAALALLGETPLFDSMGDYFDELRVRQPVINVAALVGHANLRLAAMRDPTAQPTAEEQSLMQRMLADALEAGAVGFSTGLAYQPGGMARQAELEGLAHVAAAHGAMHTSHIRNEGDEVEAAVDEVLAIGRSTGCATVLSHHKCMMPRNWGKSRATLANIDRARAEGVDVALDIYPYPGSSTILIPERAETIDDIRITWSTPHPECSGEYLSDIAARWGCDKTTAAERLCPAGAIYFAMDEDEVRRIFQHECCMVGSDGLPNDAHPHPRLWGSFTRVLGRYVREAQLVTLEAAVAKMTSLPARVFGLAGRGQLSVGAWADIVVFDADTVVDRATWEEPTLASIGVEQVLVNGRQVFPAAAGMPRPGKILRRVPDAAQSLP
ncbi:N-acyl-D-amino-acid deacylase family protein [Achromobacter arsenitoxydans]|uniref:N-acyl-D-glutamate deacylase n=1 Tax=Achromobacter arsenitoxydans SY8 TaxID=477184 RepID=H0F443_9BURK|nr:D-aminoacylase [Achromobacter arsenitoxydans]EHK66938.1 N-acyl-D-glutamate deacylase [Achromobacter arsenitoxydans SY8]